jgi:chromosome segregation ATPase
MEGISCEGCEEASEQIADLTEQLQQAQSRVAALEAELAAARQQAGQACGSAVFARSQVKTLSGQLQVAAETIVSLENAAAGSKQQAAHASKELQVLREAAAAAAAAHAASAEATAAQKQRSRVRSDRERAWLRHQLAQQRRSGLQLQAQLEEANTQVGEAAFCLFCMRLPGAC